MSADGAGVDLPRALPTEPDNLVRMLLRAVAVLLRGGWRTILWPPEFQGYPVASREPHLVDCAEALRLVARSQQLQAQGRVQDAWDGLSDAAALLPERFVRLELPTNTVFALLPLEPPHTARPDVRLVVGVARLVWRDQTAMQDLKDAFDPDQEKKARDELIEAIIHYLTWVESDPAVGEPPPPGALPWNDGVTVGRARESLLDRATEIRRFGNPGDRVRVSQAPWQDNGGFLGLYVVARDRLAQRPEPAPWPRVSELRAWEDARRHRQDLASLRVPLWA